MMTGDNMVTGDDTMAGDDTDRVVTNNYYIDTSPIKEVPHSKYLGCYY